MSMIPAIDRYALAAALVLVYLSAAPALAEESSAPKEPTKAQGEAEATQSGEDEELAKKLSNPVASLISVPSSRTSTSTWGRATMAGNIS